MSKRSASADATAETAFDVGTPTTLGASIDDALWSWFAKLSGGLSPLALAAAGFDWAAHAAVSPGRSAEAARALLGAALEAWTGVGAAAIERALDADVTPDKVVERALVALRDAHAELLPQIEAAIEAAPGVSVANRRKVQFAARQAWEAAHPYNWLLTNPEALSAFRDNKGMTLLQGWLNFVQDVSAGPGREASPAVEGMKVGESLAVTPGRVVYRNALIEVIQYEPADSGRALREAILITPAWIMKYYILDLSPENSLVEHLVAQGFSVFIISWRNPGRDDRDLSFDDYRRLGVLSAIEAVRANTANARVHLVGYCLGGTLSAVTAAGLARAGDEALASLTLIAAQTDFRDAGELSLFVDEAQLTLLDRAMDASGYLDGAQMAGAFTMLRSRELFWERWRQAYLLGKRPEMIALMAWNADATRLPRRMHSEYLRRFYLNNDFVQGRLEIDDRPIAVSDIRAPIFALGATKDHVAPWRSVFKIHLFADTEVTFALATGGHNAGVVSPPGRPNRTHWVYTKADRDHYLDPDAWLAVADVRDGSWWPTWTSWLAERSTRARAPIRPRRADTASNQLSPDAELPRAPGTYVFE